MDRIDYTTEHRKGQHLTNEERHEIEVRRKDGWNINQIAKHLRRPYNTIKNEINRGSVLLYNGKVKRYKADEGEAEYRRRRQSSRRSYRWFETADFLGYVVEKVREDGWSLDACVGYAEEQNLYSRDKRVCTKTLYNYVDEGLLPIKNIDLPEKVRRNTKRKTVRENKRKLGTSIEERPEHIALREEFGHWEIDSVLGVKGEEEPAVMTIVERKTREAIWLKVRDHSADAIDEALSDLISQYGEHSKDVFKSITADNGSEFAHLPSLLNGKVPVYYTHPYTSCEKGTNECHNRMLRRFIPKGKSMQDYSADSILFFADVINGLPRRILGYRTPEELFEQELDRIYAA